MASDVLPQGFRGMWSVKPTEFVQGANLYELVAIKATSRDGKAPLDGGVVTDARVNFNGAQNGGNGAPSVSMTMNAEGASIWARLTKDNIGKQVAIVLDGLVYSVLYIPILPSTLRSPAALQKSPVTSTSRKQKTLQTCSNPVNFPPLQPSSRSRW